MNTPYTVTWTQPQLDNEQVGDYAVSPVTAEQHMLLDRYVDIVQDLLRKNGLPGTLTADSIKVLSDRINALRASWGEEEKVAIANLYGAFLGAMLIKVFPDAQPQWVSGKQGVGIQVQKKGFDYFVFFPITRVFKHIERGDEYSIYTYLLASRECVESDPAVGRFQKLIAFTKQQSGYVLLFVAAIIIFAFTVFVQKH